MLTATVRSTRNGLPEAGRPTARFEWCWCQVPLYCPGAGERNYLVDGVSGAGKTTVAEELERRGYQAVHGDRVLARRGGPVTGQRFDEPVDWWSLEQRHRHHIGDVDQVRALVSDHSRPLTFFCGGARNSAMFLDLFDGVFVLEVDVETLNRRRDVRPADEFGNVPGAQDADGRRRRRSSACAGAAAARAARMGRSRSEP